MTKAQTFIASMTVLVLGAGMVIAGLLLKQPAMYSIGAGLIGTGTGGLFIPRPTDAPASPITPTL